jgi:hypothetical protein
MENEIMGINLRKVDANASPFSSIVKMTAVRLMENPYVTLGDFFTGLTNNDLTALNFMVEMIATDGQSREELVLLTEMLSRAEGAETSDDAQRASNVSYFCNLVTIVSLHRKGLVDVMFENMSFGADMKDKPIVQAKM